MIDTERVPTYDPDYFVTPPENQGQIVEVSYGADWEQRVIVVRTHDSSDRTITYRAFNAATDRFEPWNEVPELGDEIGPCNVMAQA